MTSLSIYKETKKWNRDVQKSFLIISIWVFFIIASGLNAEEMYVNTGDGLNIRKQPSQKSEIVAKVPFLSKVKVIRISDTKMKIDDIDSEWIEISTGNFSGWVFGGYLSQNNINLTKLLGDWESKYHWYRFKDNGSFAGGRNSSGLMYTGKWTVINNKLILEGVIGDEFDTKQFKDLSIITFITDDSVKLKLQGQDSNYNKIYADEVYKRTTLTWQKW